MMVVLMVCLYYFDGNPVETALPALAFLDSWLPESVVSPPDCVKALSWFVWPMADSAFEPAETALPTFSFAAAWLHEPSLVVPD